MAARHVTRSRKDATDGDITALCNPGHYWSPRAKAGVIQDIETGSHRHYVIGGCTVRVVTGPNGKYLRTDLDPLSSNNLDNLPDC